MLASMEVIHSIESLDERDAERRDAASISAQKQTVKRNFFPCARCGAAENP